MLFIEIQYSNDPTPDTMHIMNRKQKTKIINLIQQSIE